MIYELKETSKVLPLFEGWPETLIYSCLQNIMGKVFVTDPVNPRSAMAFAGCFGFYAGDPDRELVIHKPAGFVIMVPRTEEWASMIEECFPSAKRVKRYAIRKDTRFDPAALHKELDKLPEGYELREIDSALYDLCLKEGLYPSWDAQNMNSVRLAEKLGYELDYEYAAYEVAGEERTH